VGQVILSLLSGLVGAIVGGSMAVWGSMKSLNTTMANIERAEIRKLRVECVTNLAGLRFVMGDNVPLGRVPIPVDAYIAKLMFELNRVAMLWADDLEVLNSVRNFHGDPGNKDKLFAILRSAAKTTSLGEHNLLDSDINAVFQLSRPAASA
jgi:hypothetical protein